MPGLSGLPLRDPLLCTLTGAWGKTLLQGESEVPEKQQPNFKAALLIPRAARRIGLSAAEQALSILKINLAWKWLPAPSSVRVPLLLSLTLGWWAAPLQLC